MARRRSQEVVRRARRDAYRQLVLEGAESVFARKGYDDTKMEEIARESGFSLGTVYSVFEGKADIFRAIHESGDRALLQCGIESARGIEDPYEAALTGLRSMSEYFLEHPDFLCMNLREGLPWGLEAAGAGSRQRTEAWKQGMQMLTGAFQRCVDEGAFHAGDARLMARMAVSMQQVAIATWVEDGMKRDAAAVVEEIQTQVRRSFARDAGDGRVTA